jgi:hypothetical protein
LDTLDISTGEREGTHDTFFKKTRIRWYNASIKKNI